MSAAAKIKYTGMNASEKEWEEIWEILCLCDHEYVPSLSSRNSTSQINLRDRADSTAIPCNHLTTEDMDKKPHAYFRELRNQQFILAEVEDRLVGFLSFKTEYICDALADFGHSNYITTVCVKPEHRGRGILKHLYDYMENGLPASVKCRRIATRTWSGNDAQIHTLMERGYELLQTLVNDRGAGIDTLYFGKEVIK
jgi:ribosomal protein S18 acetylase RimI-like enzyme